MVRKFGFLEEVRRHNALLCDGRVWDLLVFGLLHSEWTEQNEGRSDILNMDIVCEEWRQT